LTQTQSEQWSYFPARSITTKVKNIHITNCPTSNINHWLTPSTILNNKKVTLLSLPPGSHPWLCLQQTVASRIHRPCLTSAVLTNAK